jgi:phosphoglucosamine mutase
MALFGTDGIRGRFPEPPMDLNTATDLGRALRDRIGDAPLLLARDTRESGPALAKAVARGAGGEVLDLGVLPTPAASALLSEGWGAAAVVITASHNPWFDNGLKVLGAGGVKLSDAEEAALAREMATPRHHNAAQLHRVPCEGDRAYERLVIERAPAPWRLKGVKIALDAAHGAAARTAPSILRALGVELVVIGDAPDGKNINEGVGAVHPEALAQLVRDTGAAVGIALDGDGDRCQLIDADGELVDGDALLLLLARAPGVVGTVMSNAALERALLGRGLGFARAAVGDRYVAEELSRRGWRVGGEPSGHVLLAEGFPTGDGLLTALFALADGVNLKERLRGFRPDPQALLAVPVAQKTPLDAVPELAVIEAEARAAGVSRVLLRYSGTEPKLRVMVEAPELSLAQSWAQRLALAAQAALSS